MLSALIAQNNVLAEGINNLTNRRFVTVFQSEPQRPKYYRIPSVVTAKENNYIIAFAEERIANGNKDSGDINIVYRVSTDHGETWGSLVRVCEVQKDTCGNPTAVVNQLTGTIHLFMNSNKANKVNADKAENEEDKVKQGDRKIFYMKGKFVSAGSAVPSGYHRIEYLQNDVSKVSNKVIDRNEPTIYWTSRQDLTEKLQIYNEAWDAIGPGVGIQLETGDKKGRLVIPALRRSFYSDNDGESWKVSAQLSTKSGSETAIAELHSDGIVYRNDRPSSNFGKLKRRAVTIGKDGEIYADYIPDNSLLDPVCEGSLLRYTKDHVIFANCASAERRKLLTLRLSNGKLEGTKADTLNFFNKKAIRVDEECGYSSLTKTRDYHIGILYERPASDRKVYIDGIKAPKDIVFKKYQLTDFD